MPLDTQIKRNGKLLAMPEGWGGFHVAAMVFAASMDSGEGPFPDNSLMGIYKTDDHSARLGVSQRDVWSLVDYSAIGRTPLNMGSYTLKADYTFVDNMDGEVLDLKAGDVLMAYRR